jgi:hypothetical protein
MCVKLLLALDTLNMYVLGLSVRRPVKYASVFWCNT